MHPVVWDFLSSRTEVSTALTAGRKWGGEGAYIYVPRLCATRICCADMLRAVRKCSTETSTNIPPRAVPVASHGVSPWFARRWCALDFSWFFPQFFFLNIPEGTISLKKETLVTLLLQ